MKNEENYNLEVMEVSDMVNKYKNEYAFSINIGRSCISVLDGLKPIGRRIMTTMLIDENIKYTDEHVKVPSIIGSLLKNYHPHGRRVA